MVIDAMVRRRDGGTQINWCPLGKGRFLLGRRNRSICKDYVMFGETGIVVDEEDSRI